MVDIAVMTLALSKYTTGKIGCEANTPTPDMPGTLGGTVGYRSAISCNTFHDRGMGRWLRGNETQKQNPNNNKKQCKKRNAFLNWPWHRLTNPRTKGVPLNYPMSINIGNLPPSTPSPMISVFGILVACLARITSSKDKWSLESQCCEEGKMSQEEIDGGDPAYLIAMIPRWSSSDLRLRRRTGRKAQGIFKALS